MSMSANGEIKVKSLQKALEVLNCFTYKQQLGVTEISEMLELYKSNVHNILNTYTAMGYLEQDAESGKYKLGIKIFELSRALGDRFEISKIAAPYMQQIANQTGDNVYLAVLHADEVLYLEAMYPESATHLMRSILGDRAELYCTGLGKAMLAQMPDAYIQKYLDRTFKSFTEQTITHPELLMEELKKTKMRGYAIDNMEHEFGIKCVALPIFDRQHQVVGAMSVSGNSLNFTEERITEIAELIKKYVIRVEQRL